MLDVELKLIRREKREKREEKKRQLTELHPTRVNIRKVITLVGFEIES